jgi:hypothetical protein
MLMKDHDKYHTLRHKLENRFRKRYASVKTQDFHLPHSLNVFPNSGTRVSKPACFI